MPIEKPTPYAQGVENTIDNEVIFSSHSVLMNSGRTLQEEWNLLISNMEQLKNSFDNVKNFVGNRIPVPFQKGTLTFSKGLWQEPVWSNYSSEFMSVSGTLTGVHAGKYDVTFTLNSPDYVWSDGETGAHTVSWYIQPLQIPVPVQATPYSVFDGDMKTPVWSNITGEEIDIVGGFSEKAEAGIHRISVKPKSDYCWTDGTSSEKELFWTIERAEISLPVQVGELHYDGRVQMPVWDENGRTTLVTVVDGDISGTDAKTYEVWFKPTDNAVWTDGTFDMKKTVWTILPKVLDYDITAAITSFVFDGEYRTPVFNNYDSDYVEAYDITVNSNGTVNENPVLVHRDAGSYITKFTVKDNVTWSDGTKTPVLITWNITPKEIDIPFISWNGITDDVTLVYEGDIIGPDINNCDSKWIIAESVKALTTEIYTAKFSLKEANNTVWSNGTTQPKTFTWQIIPRLIKVPDIINDNIIYHGGLAVSPVLEEYDSRFISLEGNSAVHVHDNYPITFKLKDPVNTKWEDGTIDDKVNYWSVTARTISVPSVTNLSFVYDGEYQGPDVGDYDTQYILISNYEGINVNTYNLTMSLLKDGTVWEDTLDSEPKVIEWTINKKRIPVPEVTNKDNKIYDTRVQYVTVRVFENEDHYVIINTGFYLENDYNGRFVNVTGMLGQTANSYTVICSLVDTNNTVWDTGSDSPISIPWTIAPKVLLVPAPSQTYDYNGEEHICEFENYNATFMEVTGYIETEAGRHTAVFSLKDKINTMWPDGSVTNKSVFWYIGAIVIDPDIVSIHDADTVWDNETHMISTNNIEGFDPDIMVLEGEVSGTKVKNYTAKVLLKDNYAWTDNRPYVELKWNITKRIMTVPVIATAHTVYDYTGEEVTITKDQCVFGDIKDKDFIVIKDGSGIAAKDYTLKFAIDPAFSAFCAWTGNVTSDQPAAWRINKGVLGLWFADRTTVDITGTPGSYADIMISRQGDGEVKVYKSNDNFSADIIGATSDNPVIRVMDENGPVQANVAVKVAEGTNYLSSTDSNAKKVSSPATVNITVNILTNRAPSDFAPSRLKEIVQQGFASSLWSVGDRIPIPVNRFTLSGTSNDYIPAAICDAIILGFDHNMSKETPSASHTMTVALLYEHDITENAVAFYDRTIMSPLANYNGSYCNNVFEAINSSWQKIILPVRKYNGDSYQQCTVFNLSSYEVYGNGGPGKTASSDWINQKQYDYFKTHDLPSKIYPLCKDKISQNVHVTSRSTGQGDGTSNGTVIAFLTQTGYYYDNVQTEWLPYGYADWRQTPLTYHTVNYSTDIQTGMIPCFVIG